MILMEPWISGVKADRLIQRLGFGFNIRHEAEGFSRRIWILWNNASINISLILKRRQFIHVKVISNNYSGFLIVVYGSPNFAQRSLLWEALCSLTPSSSEPWLLVGNFNSFFWAKNKSGGRPITSR